MIVYKHYTSRDTCFEIIERRDNNKAFVNFFNLNLQKVSGEKLIKCYCGYGEITLAPEKEYEVFKV